MTTGKNTGVLYAKIWAKLSENFIIHLITANITRLNDVGGV
jgi:hypothetical protein